MEAGTDSVLETKERMSHLPLSTKTINMWLNHLHLLAMPLPQLLELQQAMGKKFKFFITIPTPNDWMITSCVEKNIKKVLLLMTNLRKKLSMVFHIV